MGGKRDHVAVVNDLFVDRNAYSCLGSLEGFYSHEDLAQVIP
jgi:hypothetical protein